MVFYIGAAGRTVYDIRGRSLTSALDAEFAVVLRAAGRADPRLFIDLRWFRFGTWLRFVRADVVISDAVIACVPILTVNQNILKLNHLLLIFVIQIGIAAFGTVSVAQFQLYLVEPWRIHPDFYIEFIIISITS